MAFDGLLIRNLINELKFLETGRISKIQQISKLEILLTIRAKSSNHKLLISCSSDYARMHITNNKYDVPNEPPSFCMMLRKHLDGGFINNISQHENDRIIIIDILKVNELGDKVSKKLHFEAMGKHSNLILSEEGKILESIKHIPPFMNTYRTILPGADYLYPPSTKINPFIEFNNTATFSEIMSYQGISPLMANEILFQSNPDLIYSKPDPVIIRGNKERYYFIPVNIEGNIEHYNSISEMLDVFFFNKDSFDRIRQRAKDLSIYIRRELDKNINKLDKLKNDLDKANDNQQLRIIGEVLLANLNQLKRGMNKVTLTNFYDNSNIEIHLNPLLTPTENANKYFNKYQKAKKAINHLINQIDLTKLEIEYFELLSQQINQATYKDVDEIRVELEENNYLKKRSKKKIKKLNYLTYLSKSGTEILVGKNNKQNEYLTHKYAKKNDIWMHTKDIPGSHVIIRDDNPDEDTIRTAANLAAYYSKAKDSSSVPIDYTFIKYIKKIPGRQLCFVTYTNQKTIYIDPNPEFIQELTQK
ncbi:NFACT RNA binding domain-containing protein [Mycoplasmatota bacterium zrk1]